MSDWPGDSAPLPHAVPEDRLGARLAGMVAAPCEDCGHRHTLAGCVGPPTPSDLWAGVSPAVCDCTEETA